MQFSSINKKSFVRQSIKWKMIFVLTLFMSVLVMLLSYIHLSANQTILETSLQERIKLMKENWIAASQTYATAFTRQLENEIAAYNFSGAASLAEAGVRENSALVRVVLKNREGEVLLSAPATGMADLPEFGPSAPGLSDIEKSIRVREIEFAGRNYIEAVGIVRVSTEPMGTVSFVFSEADLEAAVRVSRALNRKKMTATIERSVMTSLGFVSLCILLAYILALRLSAPLMQLTREARRLSTGDFSVPYRPQTKTKDEIGLLAEAFSAMSSDLKASYDNLGDANRTLEEKVRARTAELKQRNIDLDKANRTKSQFIANMSHEFRTPLTAIIGLTDVVLNTDSAERVRRPLETVKASARSLLSMINEILDFSKIEVGKLELMRESFQLIPIMEELIDLFATEAFSKEIELTVFADKGVPEDLIGDPLRLKQVLTNLTSNALKFTDKGEVNITASVITSTVDNTVVQFLVEDTGIGFPPEMTSELFESFVQADGSTTRKYGGSGLGLSISKHLVEMMGGDIHVDSVPGHGSRFLFTAAFETVDQPAADKPFTHPSKVAFLITMNSGLASNARNHLESFGFDVTWARSLLMAKDMRDTEWPIKPVDLIIGDEVLLNGANSSLLTDAGLNSPCPRPPVVAMLPGGHAGRLSKDANKIIDGVVRRPLKRDKLRQTVTRVLRAVDVAGADDTAAVGERSAFSASGNEDVRALITAFETLWQFLEENNLRGCTYMEETGQFLFGQAGLETSRLAAQLDRFDFKGARRTLREMAFSRGVDLGKGAL